MKSALPLLALAISIVPAMAQQVQPGRMYAFHTVPTGGCPGLDWHIVVDPDNELTGFVTWDRMKHMANLSGKLDPKTGKFHMDAKEVGGTRTPVVEGVVTQKTAAMTVVGTGTGCDNQKIQIPRVPDGYGLGGGGG